MSQVTDGAACATAAAAVITNDAAAVDPGPDNAMRLAVNLRPNAIMFVTARPIDDATRTRLLGLLVGSPSKVLAYSLNLGSSDNLKAIATATGGQYKDLSSNQLASYAR
jgi:hypothetical protein